MPYENNGRVSQTCTFVDLNKLPDNIDAENGYAWTQPHVSTFNSIDSRAPCSKEENTSSVKHSDATCKARLVLGLRATGRKVVHSVHISFVCLWACLYLYFFNLPLLFFSLSPFFFRFLSVIILIPLFVTLYLYFFVIFSVFPMPMLYFISFLLCLSHFIFISFFLLLSSFLSRLFDCFKCNQWKRIENLKLKFDSSSVWLTILRPTWRHYCTSTVACEG